MLNRLPLAFVDFLLTKGPAQPTDEDIPSKEFPKDKSGRNFQVAWYWKKLPYNTDMKRLVELLENQKQSILPSLYFIWQERSEVLDTGMFFGMV